MKEFHIPTLAMGVFFVLAGGAFLLEALDVWNLRVRHVWPLVLIGFGVAIVAGSLTRDTGRDR